MKRKEGRSKASWFCKKKKKWGLEVLQRISGTRGILVTCAVNQENRCANEIVDFLTTVIESMKEEKEKAAPATTTTALPTPTALSIPTTTHHSMSFEAALAEEREEIMKEKSEENNPIVPMLTGVNGVVYISIKDETISPTNLCIEAAKRILHHKEGDIHLRQTIRLEPLERTCQAFMSDLKTMLDPMISKEFSAGGSCFDAKTFKIELRKRNSSGLHLEEVSEVVKSLISGVEKGASNNGIKGAEVEKRRPVYKGADCVVLIEAFKGNCGASIVYHFDSPEIHGFNLRALSESLNFPPSEDQSLEVKHETPQTTINPPPPAAAVVVVEQKETKEQTKTETK